jgi:hypothetical protein
LSSCTAKDITRSSINSTTSFSIVGIRCL